MELGSVFSTVVILVACCQPIFVEADGHGEQEKKILILGAGMSGLSAAKTLTDKGFTNFVIIEGSDRVGGRVKDVDLGGFTVSLGCMWIYGRGSNPLSILIDRYNIASTEADSDDWIVYNEEGDDVTDDADAIYETQFGPAYEAAVNMSEEERVLAGRPDFSARASLRKEGWIPMSALDNAVEYFTYDFEFAVPPEEVSVKHAYYNDLYDAHNSDTVLIVNDKKGPSEILRRFSDEFLTADDPRLRLNEVVISIVYTGDQVVVQTTKENHTCDYVIVTFSIGVLQHREVLFSPPLPEWKRDSIDEFTMTSLVQIYLQFPEKFWDDNEYIVFASEHRGYFTAWQNLEVIYPGSKILQLTLSGDEATRISRMTEHAVVSEAHDVLKQMYQKRNQVIPAPSAYRISTFGTDPLFRGAYTNWPPAYDLDTYDGLRAPVGNIYFAGEHLAGYHYSYLHGAFYSGAQTANDVIDCITNSSTCVTYTPAYRARGCTYSSATNYDAAAKQDDGSCLLSCPVSAASSSGCTRLLLGVSFISLLLQV